MSYPVHEELYVVSDLHLGGTSGQPIFRQGEELAGLIDQLARRTPPRGGGLALVLNGDVIDTLAEDIQHYVATPAEAAQALERIFRHPHFRAVWEAMAGFVRQPKHRLLFVLGNHDLELSLPNVQEQIVTELGGEDEAARGRIAFMTAGFGYRCEVGAKDSGLARVVCVHGNEFDPWNALAPESMARLGRASILGKESPLAEESPNAGTKLVIDVMNSIKRKWPFVDLLKPEIESVFNVVLALEPRRVTALGGVLAALSGALTVGRLRTGRVLSGVPDQTANAIPQAAWAPGKAFSSFLAGAPAQDLLAEAWRASKDASLAPEKLAEQGTDVEVLGGTQLALNALNFAARRIFSSEKKALQAALEDWGGAPETWLLEGPCDVFETLAKLDPAADVVIAGHTHLRRQRQLPGARGALYLNTGTWARLMCLPLSMLQSDADFDVFWQALREGSMKVLDKELTPRGWLMNQPTVAVVRTNEQGTGVEAALCEFVPGEPAYERCFRALKDGNFSQVPSR